jgi:ParB/RepB/Spo0J family partition protein
MKEIKFDRVEDIPIEMIDFDYKENCRELHHSKAVDDLVASLASTGQSTPIQVYRTESGRYGLIAGYRRTTAAKKLGWKTIKAAIADQMPDTQTIRVLNAQENITRSQLTDYEMMMAVGRIFDDTTNMTASELAKHLGLDPRLVGKMIDVYQGPKYVHDALREGKYLLSHAHMVVRARTEELRREVHDKLVNNPRDQRLMTELKYKLRNVESSGAFPRNKAQIEALRDEIYDKLGPSLATRCLAWAAGYVSDAELIEDLKSECNGEKNFYF